jgi:hypothetical protein
LKDLALSREPAPAGGAAQNPLTFPRLQIGSAAADIMGNRAAVAGATNLLAQMPQTYLIFADIEGKLDVLRVECTKCDRKGPHTRARPPAPRQGAHHEHAG